MSSPKEIIEKIRKIRFGIGLDTSNLSSDQIDALKDKAKVLEDAARLAREINTKKPHFVLELVQNAEDNDYENGVVPRIRFVIKHNELMIQNNERGYEEKNVWALCGIGETTKKNRSLGYIGEKGIGFKSVFMVTDEPLIFSKGLQFKFKYEKENPKSILIPHWVEEVPGYVDQRETNILLPLKSEVNSEINEYLGQIHESLLLFLTKLRVIEVENKVLGKSETIGRYDYDGIIEIRHGTKKSYWRIARKRVTVSDHIKEERRKDIKETEIVLAFPINNDGSAETTQEQHVFAFLPIRKYGFKFIIQADFLLPIGREDIIKDNDWNKWLRDCIGPVFLDTIETFKADEKLKYTFYNYIPIENGVDDDFFVSVVKQIHEELQKIECLLTESSRWKKPSDVLMADDEVRGLVANDDLQSFFNKEYLSMRIEVTKDILRKLKVDEFSVDELLEFLKDLGWVKKQNDEWFVRLYTYLGKQELTEEQITLIKRLNILKLENGELASTVDGLTFLPLSRKGRNYGFETELRVIKKSIWELIRIQEERDKDSKIRDFLKRLGIRSPQPYEIIENHILPTYEDESWKEKDATVLLGYVRYIKDNLEEYEKESDRRLNAKRQSWESKEDPLKRLKKSLFIRINKKDQEWYASPEKIYLPQIYGNTNDLETLFQGIDVNLLHPCYVDNILREREKKTTLDKKLTDIKEIEEKTRKADKIKNEKIKRWREFFLKLGVSDLLIVKKDPQTEMYEGDSYANNKVTKKQVSKWEKEKTTWKNCAWEDTDWRGYYISDDWISEGFDKFAQKLEKLSEDSRTNLCKKLIFLLDKNWNKYQRYKSCRYYYRYSGQFGWYHKETPSTFLLTLQNVAWYPTTQNTLAKPSQIFLDKSDVREVLGDSVSYLALEVKNEDFIKDMGFNTEANVKGVLSYLKALVEQACPEKNKFEKLYSFLSRNFENNEKSIREAFSNHHLIHIPNTEKKFFTIRGVIWKDVSDIFGENRAYLEENYPELKYFFVEKLGVTEKPLPKDYADVLVDIAERDEITDKDKHVVLKIYEELNHHLDLSIVEKPVCEEDWWVEFVSKPIFLTEKEEFWHNEEDVFINDNKELHDLLKEEEDIAFLLLPKGYHPDKIRFFIEATGIRYLSNATEIMPIFDESSSFEHKEFTEQIQNLIPYIIRYLYWKENSKYEELKSKGSFDNFTNLKVYTVNKLQAKYTINIGRRKSVSANAERICILYQNKLYVFRELGDNTDYIAIELSRIFGQIKGLDSFIISIYEKRSHEKIEDLLTIMSIQVLPQSESGVLERLLSKAQKIEEIPTVPKEEVVKPSPSPPGYERKPTEHEYPSDLTKEKTVEDWTPEYPPEQAEVRSEEYVPKDIQHPYIIEEAMKKKHIPLESEQQVPPSGTRELKALSEQSKFAIGNWGEKYALKCLKEGKMKEYQDAILMDTDTGFVVEKDGKTLVKVVWLNKDGDQGRGHDIELWENNTVYCIEVKSTKTDEKDWFDVSKGQWALMQEKGEEFYIYRVFGAGTRKPSLIKIRDPVKLWRDGGIDAYPVRIQL